MLVEGGYIDDTLGGNPVARISDGANVWGPSLNGHQEIF